MFGIGGRGVVSMNEREKKRAMAPLRIVESYWMALRSADKVPLRSEIDPRGMEDALEYAFLAEKLGPSLLKVRVAGSHMNDLMGMEVAGMPLSAMFTPAARNRLADAIPHLFQGPSILRIKLRGEAGLGRPDLEGELLILPLRSDMDDVSRALGCLATHGSIGRKPRRFDIVSASVIDAFDARDVTQVPSPIEAQPVAPTGMAEDAAKFETKSINRGKRPNLRIVVSND